MSAIAGLALAFAILPTPLSVAFAVTVLGILVLKGMHLPLVTRGDGVRSWLPWALWALALATCPVAIATVGELYEYHGSPDQDRWAVHVVDRLGYAHLGVMVVASVAVILLTRGIYRWLAWALVLAIGVITGFVLLGAEMATSGAYL
jgi:hypothetical protein